MDMPIEMTVVTGGLTYRPMTSMIELRCWS
jgi:hypothetical protein